MRRVLGIVGFNKARSTTVSTAVPSKICLHLIVGISECKQKRQNGAMGCNQILKNVLNLYEKVTQKRFVKSVFNRAIYGKLQVNNENKLKR